MKVVLFAKEGKQFDFWRAAVFFYETMKESCFFFFFFFLACKKIQLNFMSNFSLFPYLRFLATSFFLTIKLKTPPNEVTVPCYDQASYSHGKAGKR